MELECPLYIQRVWCVPYSMNNTVCRRKMFITMVNVASWLSSCSAPTQPLLKPLLWGEIALYDYGFRPLYKTSDEKPKKNWQKNSIFHKWIVYIFCVGSIKKAKEPIIIQEYSLYKARIFKILRSPGIDSKESIPPAYVAWRAGTITLSLCSVPSPHRLFKNSSSV